MKKSYFTFTLVGLLFCLALTLKAEVLPGLVGYWTFDEMQGITANDSSGNNNHGSLNGPIWQTGYINGALLFNGTSNYVSIPNQSSLNPTSAITISAWFNRSPYTSGNRRIVQKGNNDTQYLLVASANQNRLEFRVRGLTNDFLTAPTPLPSANEWHHVAGTYNGADMVLYLDGQPIASQPASGQIWTSSDPLYIGTKNPSAWASDFFDGLIDDVRIYNRALSQVEIDALIYSGPPVSLEILGPDQVAENSSASYKAIAHYDDGSTSDVTSSAVWSVDPASFASIDSSGLLTTADIEKFQNLTLTASYTHQGLTVEDQKAVTVFAVCPTGSALQFDGVNDYIFIPANVSESKYTLSLWFKTTDPYTGIIGISKGWESFDREIFLSNGNLCARLWQEQTIKTTGQNYADGQWHHVAHVFGTDVGGQKLYVDGKEMASGSKSSSNFNFEEEIKVGWAKSAVNDYFKGFIDDLRIWNRSLTLEEIKSSMHIPLSLESPDLYGYWNFDEGNGQIVYDISGNGHDGYLGSNPNSDDSDPLWIVSDAPVGVCTPYVTAVQNIKSALQKKLRALEAIDAALENEQKAMDAVVEFLLDKDFGDLKPMDILKAKLEIRLAMQKQINAQNDLRKSIQHLERSLLLLGVDIVPHEWPDTPKLKSCNLADINQDGKVGAADLLLLRQNWLKTE